MPDESPPLRRPPGSYCGPGLIEQTGCPASETCEGWARRMEGNRSGPEPPAPGPLGRAGVRPSGTIREDYERFFLGSSPDPLVPPRWVAVLAAVAAACMAADAAFHLWRAASGP
jgi:hypothetical protein